MAARVFNDSNKCYQIDSTIQTNAIRLILPPMALHISVTVTAMFATLNALLKPMALQLLHGRMVAGQIAQTLHTSRMARQLTNKAAFYCPALFCVF